jgi:hypothetical protein
LELQSDPALVEVLRFGFRAETQYVMPLRGIAQTQFASPLVNPLRQQQMNESLE